MTILYATDGSESAAVAGRLLATMFRPADARVTVLSAVGESGWVETAALGAEAPLYPGLAELIREEETAARQAAESAAAALRAKGFAATVHARRQHPADAILEQARQDGAELIVVGSHGKGTMERFLLGSVSERVARYAPCSVLVARGERLRRVLLAFDGSESAEEALATLARLPLPAETTITVVYVVRSSEVVPPYPLIPGLNWTAVMDQYDRERRAAGEGILRQAQERLRAAGHETRSDVRLGAPAHELVAAAQESEADLLVVGAANRSGLGRFLLGSVSDRVLSHAQCSVLVARSTEEIRRTQ